MATAHEARTFTPAPQRIQQQVLSLRGLSSVPLRFSANPSMSLEPTSCSLRDKCLSKHFNPFRISDFLGFRHNIPTRRAELSSHGRSTWTQKSWSRSALQATFTGLKKTLVQLPTLVSTDESARINAFGAKRNTEDALKRQISFCNRHASLARVICTAAPWNSETSLPKSLPLALEESWSRKEPTRCLRGLSGKAYKAKDQGLWPLARTERSRRTTRLVQRLFLPSARRTVGAKLTRVQIRYKNYCLRFMCS